MARIADAPRIAALRNTARYSFLDCTEVTPAGTAAWLARMGFPREALLRIETESGAFLGVIGWSDLSPERGEALFGRVMIDIPAVMRELPRGRRDAGYDAARALASYAFDVLGLARLFTCYIVSNRAAARLNDRVGMTPTGLRTVRRNDGSLVELVDLVLTRERWLALSDDHDQERPAGRAVHA